MIKIFNKLLNFIAPQRKTTRETLSELDPEWKPVFESLGTFAYSNTGGDPKNIDSYQKIYEIQDELAYQTERIIKEYLVKNNLQIKDIEIICESPKTVTSKINGKEVSFDFCQNISIRRKYA